MDPLVIYLHIVWLRARAALATFAAQEPVRLRAALTSLVLAAGVLAPALADGHTAERVAGVAAVALPIVVGEGTRKRVTPTK
ncbi:hypothetical protein ACGFZB_28625 [Streptomyces cinerochromogenes]|uniref:Uncharacterized protein n=1 Tax=Streptomyces cinerochromogenes TaxID=66422 RepID=A0ABW7BEY0_9ACTN